MAFSIATNIASLNAQTNLNKAQSALSQSVERLSSGLKINKGADGPAALVISEKQKAQIAGLQQAIDNSNKAVSLVQTAEGALGEINDLLVKIRSLALDSANAGVNDDDALAANQAEISNALDTINRIASNTQFGTKKLLDGSAGIQGALTSNNVTFLRGTSDTNAGTYAVSVTTAGERATVTAGTAQTDVLAADETLTVNGVSISLNAGLSQAQVVSRINAFTGQTGVVADIDSGATRLYSNAYGSDTSISVVSNVAAGATSSGFGSTVQTDSGVDVAGTIDGTSFTGVGNTLSATSGAAKGVTLQFATDGSDPTSTVTGAQGNLTISDKSLVFQIGPNQNQTAKVTIGQVNSHSLGIGVTGNQFANLSQIDVSSSAKAQDSIGIIDQAINDITNLRGDLGAFQENTLSSTANNLQTTLQNTTNAESVITDTDFASEIANYTKNQVLVQAGTSILSNANQIPQLVLKLLQ
jgi:flagellin